MYHEITSLETYQKAYEQNDAVLFYFSHQQCNVCKVLKPKIAELMAEEFPKIKLFYCDTVLNPEIAAQNNVFAVPSILIYFGGKELIRKSRNLGIDELRGLIERPFGLMFKSVHK
jgi:thioredoxin 1